MEAGEAGCILQARMNEHYNCWLVAYLSLQLTLQTASLPDHVSSGLPSRLFLRFHAQQLQESWLCQGWLNLSC
jgi:hypothetical protein